ncbi:MAG: tetratricopeptide repeat protein [Cyanobacteria bacterium J06648_16]
MKWRCAVAGLALSWGCATEENVRSIHLVKPMLPPASAFEPWVLPLAAKKAQEQRGLGLQYRNAGDFESAIATLRSALSLDSTQLSTYVVLGWTLHLDKQRPAAAAVLESALDQAPDHVPALNALGIVYLTEGDLEQAVTTHTRAAGLKPDNEIAYYNLSLAYERLGEYEQAIAAATEATALEPSNPHPWVALALSYWSSGEVETATDVYRQALGLDGRYRDRTYLDHLIDAGFSPSQVETTAEILGQS